MIGRALAHYQVTDKLGAGGMGEVYLARDTRLARDVAIKVLPAAFADDKERLLRFEREAQVLASLNHPNIAAIYGLDQSDDGMRFLAMEYVPGESPKGPIAIDELMPIVHQLVDALEEAHERGIVHRDLKPANIKVTPDGKVKVLDFGLAKALADDPASAISANSPTLALSAYTKAGVLLGTAAYMSPEQARGKPVDKRTDIFAFGAVLYELLTGSQAFGGETMSDSLAAILTRDLDLARLPASTPVNLRKLLARCLEKDPKRRLRDIGEARVILDEPPPGLVDAAPASPLPVARLAWLPWALAALFAITAGVAVWRFWPAPPVRRTVVHMTAPAPELSRAALRLALSRDGSRLAWSTGPGGVSSPIYLRMLDQIEPKPLPGTEGGRDPFFSPDGQWVGFFAGGEWKKVQVVGGATITLCRSTNFFGGTWGPDGTIVFSGGDGLSKVSAAGGKPQPLTTLDTKKGDISHRWPEFLPGGRVVVFTVGRGGPDAAAIAAVILETGETKELLQGGSFPRYVATGPATPGGRGDGHLVYWRAGSLFAVPFDLRRLEVTGSPIPVVEGVGGGALGRAMYAVSEHGTLVYLPGGRLTDTEELTMEWVDRQGKAEALPAPPRAYSDVRLSPDGQRIGTMVRDGANRDIWLYDLARGTLTRLTFQDDNAFPIWTPDGRHVTFRNQGAAKSYLALAPADGGPVEKLVDVEARAAPTGWSPDGKLLAYDQGPPLQSDIMLLPRPASTARPFLQTQFGENAAVFSPDGKWVAYASNDSNRQQVYVRPWPGAGGTVKWQISVDGGTSPRWTRGGRELIFRNVEKVMSVEIEAGATFRAGTPKLLFSHAIATRRTQGGSNVYDVSADGKRFLFLKRPEEPRLAEGAPQLHFIFEWPEDIRRRVRAGGGGEQ